MATAGKKAQVNISGDPVAFTDESTSTTDDQTYQIDDTTKRVWDPTATITVKEDGVATTEEFTVNRLTGTITFATVDALRGVITVDGQYLPMTEAGEAFEYSFTITGSNEDSTVFGNEFISRTQALLDVDGSLSTFKADTTLEDEIFSGDSVVIEIFVNRDNNFTIKIRALMSTVEDSSSVDGLVEESVDFEGVQDADGRVIARS